MRHRAFGVLSGPGPPTADHLPPARPSARKTGPRPPGVRSVPYQQGLPSPTRWPRSPYERRGNHVRLALLHRCTRGRQRAASDHGHPAGRHPGTDHRRRRVLPQPARPGHPDPAGARAAAPGARPDPGHRLRLRPDRADLGDQAQAAAGLGGRREHPRAGAGPAERGGARPGQRAGGAAGGRPRGPAVRGDLLQPADPGRQGRTAPAAAPVARPAHPGRLGVPGGPEAPGIGLAAEVAERPGLPDHPRHVGQRVPDSGSAAPPEGAGPESGRGTTS